MIELIFGWVTTTSRLIYTAPAFRLGPWKASNRRTVHIAIDIFTSQGTELFAPEGEVVTAEYRDNQLDYGGVIILKHTTPDKDEFLTYMDISIQNF